MRDNYLFKPETLPVESKYAEHRDRQEDIIELFTGIKRGRKLLANNLTDDIKQRLAPIPKTQLTDTSAEDQRVKKIHNELHWYEQTYLHIGGDWGRFQGALKLRYPTSVKLVPAGKDKYRVEGTFKGLTANLGEISVNDGRFEPLPVQPTGVQHTVYQRIGKPDKHYVKLSTSDTFVKRFVFRGLNAGDCMNLSGGQPLKAVFGKDTISDPELKPGRFTHGKGHALSVDEQILSHTRGWQKRFISTGVSGNRPAYSTRGTVFVSMYGTSVIDLAKVPNATIWDVHRPDTAGARLGVDPKDLTTRDTAYPSTGFEDEKYLALRDTVRTRELLIKGQIPHNAVKANSLGQFILAVCYIEKTVYTPFGDLKTGLLAPVAGLIMEDENPSYQINGRFWHFFSFNSVADCNRAHDLLTTIPVGTATTCKGSQRIVKMKLNRYQHVVQTGM
jgi:hypothetical protein